MHQFIEDINDQLSKLGQVTNQGFRFVLENNFNQDTNRYLGFVDIENAKVADVSMHPDFLARPDFSVLMSRLRGAVGGVVLEQLEDGTVTKFELRSVSLCSQINLM